MKALRQHPLSAAFPAMPEDEFSELVADIKTHGQRDAATLFEEQVLDGWHRVRACSLLGIEPKLIQLPKQEDPVSWVESRNLYRRHLNSSQRALAVVACHEWAKSGSNTQHPHLGEEPGSAPPATSAEMAKKAGVTDRSIRQAKKVFKAASDDVKDAVRSGGMSLKAAVETVNQKAKPVDENRVEQDPATRGSSIPAAEPPSIVAQRAPGPVTVTTAAKLNPPAADSRDESGQPDATQLLDELNADLRAAQSRIETLEHALQADDAKAQTLIAIKRAEHAERRTEEVMQDSAAAKRRADFYERQLSRIGKAVGEKDLDRVAPKVEAMARAAKEAV